MHGATIKMSALRFGSTSGVGFVRVCSGCPLAMNLPPRWYILLQVENHRYREFLEKKKKENNYLSKSRPGSFTYFYVIGHFMSLQKSKQLNYLSQIYPIGTIFHLI